MAYGSLLVTTERFDFADDRWLTIGDWEMATRD
jgi:hypothetical protein